MSRLEEIPEFDVEEEEVAEPSSKIGGVILGVGLVAAAAAATTILYFKDDTGASLPGPMRRYNPDIFRSGDDIPEQPNPLDMGMVDVAEEVQRVVRSTDSSNRELGIERVEGEGVRVLERTPVEGARVIPQPRVRSLSRTPHNTDAGGN